MTSQSTPHYNLGKFITTDIPSWLTDVNGNMDKLDTALYTLAQAQQKLQSDLDTAISELETAQGNITSIQEHSAVQDSTIASLQATVTNLTNSISAINTAITAINTFNTRTVSIGTTVPSGYSKQAELVEKNSKRVTGNLDIRLPNSNVNSLTTIATLESAYRPIQTYYTVAVILNHATKQSCLVQVLTDGSCVLQTDLTANCFVSFNLAHCTA